MCLVRFELTISLFVARCFLLLNYKHILERVKGIEPSSSGWKPDIIAFILHSHMVQVERIELSLPKEPDPKSGVST